MLRDSSLGMESVKKVLQRQDLKDDRARAFWHAIGAIHGSKGLVEEIPNMPCTVTVAKNKEEEEDEESEFKAGRPQPGFRDAAQPAPSDSAQPAPSDSYQFQFAGAPCPMRPLLKQMVRFERPFITWDIWNERPPLAFPGTATPTSVKQ